MKPAPPDHLGDPVQPVGLWNVANVLTMVRLALVPVFAVLLFHGTGDEGGQDAVWRWAAFVVFGVAAATDLVDGELARSRGLVTTFGKVADPIADKALMGTALVGLSILGELPWWVTVVILVREVGVTLLRFWVIRDGVIPASRGGKLKTLLQGIAIGLFVAPLSGWPQTVAEWVMGAAVAITLVTGADYVGKAVRLHRSARAAREHRPADTG